MNTDRTRLRIAAASILLLMAALPLSGQMEGGDTKSSSMGQIAPSRQVTDSYNGIAVLDSHGEAWVSLPASFELRNPDFSYQLTAIGAPAPNLYIAQKIVGNRFKIAGGKSAMEVSWQVISLRHDTRAVAIVTPAEEVKQVEKPALPPSVPADPAILTSQDIANIKDMLERQLKVAFESRSMSEMRKVWPEMPRVAKNDIANLFQSSDIQNIKMDLTCTPAVTANHVLAYCSQTFNFSLDRKAQAPLQLSVVYRLKRTGGEWRLEESRRGLATTARGLSD